MSEQSLTRESLVEFFGEEEFQKLCNHEAGHALVAFLFKRPLDYVKMDRSKERPGITHIAGSELERAMSEISELDGREVGVDVVNEIFGKFCVGK